ncbi:MAG: UvrD-helicase domain-containing protein [Phycisphaeraceae bacterium]
MSDLITSHDRAGLPAGVELDPHRVIRASAGAGKTYQLTLRYLRLLAAGVPAETILATTFTRKAAGEILARVLGRLAQAASDDGARRDLGRDLDVELTRAHCRAMLVRLARQLHRLAISTIDSLFNRIASTFRFELELPLDPQLMDEGHPVARQLRLEAIEAMLADHDLPTLLDLLRRLHHDAAARPVTQAIDAIVADLYGIYREAPDRELWGALHVPAGLLDKPALAAAVDALRLMGDAIPTNKGDGQPKQHWANAWHKSLIAADADAWDDFLATGIAGKLAAGADKFDRVAIPDDWCAVYEPVVAHAKASRLRQWRDYTLATFDLLARFDAHYTQRRAQHRVLLFSDLTHKLARQLPAMGDDLLMEIYFRLDAQVSHLLLDEFQDTSLDQWRVLAPFAEEIRDLGPDPNHSDRSFFCVGDTKQAIYGWRGGCAELFDEVEAAFPGSGMPLNTSWRSSPIVLDAVNAVFENLHRSDALADDAEAAGLWEAGFASHTAAPKNSDMPGHVRLVTSAAEPDTHDDADKDEDPGDDADAIDLLAGSPHETFVAAQVQAIHQASPGRSIGVLVKTNKAGHRLIHALRLLGLHVSGEGGNPLTDCPAVAAMLSAMTLADHPGHSAAAFHVANSPLGEVVGLTTNTPGAAEAAALGIRRRLLSDGYAATLADWTRQVAPACNGRSLTRLLQLVDLAEQYTPMLSLRPSQFAAYVEATNVEEPTPAPIRVMTVHRAKGLEFDAVVLAELDRALSNRWEVLVDRPTPTADIAAVYRNPAKALREQSSQLVEAYDKQRAAQRREDLCSLYVAMTRARHALHMIVKPRRFTASGKPQNLGLSFGTILRQTLGERDDDFEAGQVLYERGDAGWAEDVPGVGEQASDDTAHPEAPSSAGPARGEGRAAALAMPGESRRSWLTVSPSSLESGGRVRGVDLLNLEAGGARQRGTLMHAWCELVGFSDEEPGGPDEAALREAAQSITPGAGEPWLREQIDTFRAMLARPAVQAALKRDGADDLWRERTFVVREQDRLMRGQFDRVTVHRDGDRATAATLIDFKTDRAAGDRLPALVQMYRPQVEAYRRSLAKLLSLDAEKVTTKLVFLEAGEVVRV